MKKRLVALCAAMLAATTVTMTAFAEDFVPSPTNEDSAPNVEEPAVAVDTNGPVSPQTSDDTLNGWVVAALAFAEVAVVTFSKARKSDSN